MRTNGAALLLAGMLLWGCAGSAPPVRERPSGGTGVAGAKPADPGVWKTIEQEFRKGELRQGVYTITMPRNDLIVVNELGDIPTAAGLESRIYFFPCPCGKMTVTGQLCLADYELNDVIDELRGGQFRVTGVTPMLMGERPRLMVLLFQSDGQADLLAKTLKKAMQWVGEERMKPQKID